MIEYPIVEKIVNALQSDNYEVKETLDNSEIRGANMVAVGIERMTQVNFALPDYKSDLVIMVSTQITEDTTGQQFKDIMNEVKEKLDKYCLKEYPLSDLFQDIPVVGFWLSEVNSMLVDDEYGKCYLGTLRYTVVTSY